MNLPIPVQTRNYYKNVSDNKEIAKLVSVLSTIISSTKKVCQEDLQPGSFALQHVPVWSPALKLVLHVAWVAPSVTSVSNLWNLVCAQQMFNSRFFIPDCKVKENYLFRFLILSPVSCRKLLMYLYINSTNKSVEKIWYVLKPKSHFTFKESVMLELTCIIWNRVRFTL